MLTYVLITPARDEAEFIELTIKSVIAQTIQPAKWVIVSDGSTDGTDEIVLKYAAEHPWIQLVRMPARQERHFAGKVHAFNAGYEQVREMAFDVIVSLDADISFPQDYFSFLMGRLETDPELGLIGTPFREGGSGGYDYGIVGLDHVSGACQVFRRQCFEQIGGYVPVKGGGIDFLAVITARMKGWKTRTFTGKECTHHRQMGTAQQGALAVRFKTGLKDYRLGTHPVWEFFRGLYQMTRRPFLGGGLLLFCGYAWGVISREERTVPTETMRFRRREQMSRLKQIVVGKAHMKRAPVS